MKKNLPLIILAFCLPFSILHANEAQQNAEIDTIEVQGIEFPVVIEKEGRTLHLNGVGLKKVMGFVKVFVGGFYLESKSHDPAHIIESEQMKYFQLHYLTSKATGEKVSDGFIKAISKANADTLVEKHAQSIQDYATAVNVDMGPGALSESLYVPGIGLKLFVNGQSKGVFEDPEFCQMYYTYIFGEKADPKLKKGYLGIK